MRICWLTAAYPGPARPWSGIFIREGALALAEIGVEITVVAPRVDADAPLKEQDGPLTIHRFPYRSGGKSFMEQGPIPPLGVASYLASGARLLRRAAREGKWGLIHAHWVLPSGLLAAAALPRLPLILQAHGSDVHTIPNKSPIARRLTQWTLGRADGVITVSRYLAESLRSELGLAAPVTVIDVGVDLDHFSPGDRGAARRALGLPNDALLAVFVGGLEQAKGVITLMEALALLTHGSAGLFFGPDRREQPDIRMALIGEGSLEATLRERCRCLNLEERLIFAGSQDRNGVLRWLRAADVFVLPSEREGLSRAVLEAQSVGLPVVATSVGGLPEVIESGVNGLLVPPGDPSALARALGDVLADASLRSRMRQAGLARAPSWSVNAKSAQLYEFYRKLLSEGLSEGGVNARQRVA